MHIVLILISIYFFRAGEVCFDLEVVVKILKGLVEFGVDGIIPLVGA